jgi:hypothetical protein
MTKSSDQYWQEGYEARRVGKPRGTNPYNIKKTEIAGPAWDQGWSSAHRSIELGYISVRRALEGQ